MKRRHFLHLGLNSLSLGLMGTLPASARTDSSRQFGQVKVPKIPGVKLPEFSGEQFIKHTPPLTTNLADVYEAVPGFDNYHPTDAAPLTLLPRNSAGDYLSVPGLFEVIAQSFCLKAGTNPPSQNKGKYGTGYLFAPLKGPKAGQIERILLRSEDHPEIPQYEVQLLLWAIIAEHKLSECPKNIQETARVLLDEKDRRGLENDVLAVVPAPLRGKVYGSLPPLVREGLEAENKMRELLAQKFAQVSGSAEELVESANAPGEKVSALYAQMEAIAMRFGPLPEATEKERVPWGQWSWHPDGFYIRLLPSGYSVTTRQLYYPEEFTLSGNSLTAPDGRVLTITAKTLTLGQQTVTLTQELPLVSEPEALIALRRAVLEAEGPGDKERPISDFLARAALSALAQAKVGKTNSACSSCSVGGGFGGAGGGGAGMGAPGTQRLAQSRAPKDNPSIARARTATKALQTFGGKATSGLNIPFFLTDKLLNWQFDMASAIDRALNGENVPHVNGPGGRECGSETWQGEPAPLPRPKRTKQGDIPQELIEAQQALSEALVNLCDVGRFRQQCEQRFTQMQTAELGRQLVAQRRRWGVAQLEVANLGEALVATYQKVGGRDQSWGETEWLAYGERLKTTGFTAEERETARRVGLTDAEINTLLAEKRSSFTNALPGGGAVVELQALCAALRETGSDYASLPCLTEDKSRLKDESHD